MSLSVGEVREIASQTLEDSGYSGVFPVPIDKIIKSKGYGFKSVDKEDVPENFSGLVNHEQKLVVINGGHNNGRKRFTAAHELGHIILHPGENKTDYRISFDNFSKNDPKETEADHFAAEILMPYKQFALAYSRHDGFIPRVADYFGVSIGAATIRAERLRLA
jgi:Zn-dependent peptidase ImmA (M78 family)